MSEEIFLAAMSEGSVELPCKGFSVANHQIDRNYYLGECTEYLIYISRGQQKDSLLNLENTKFESLREI